MRKIYIFILFMVFCYHGAFCQYPPIGILPMEYNPSFAGSVGNSRLISNFSYYRYGKYNHNEGGLDVSYDNYYPALRSGIGIIIKNSSYSVTNYQGNEFNICTPSIELAIAPKISIKGKYTLSPSMSIRYDTDFSNVSDSWRRYGETYSSKFGILFNASHYYIGYAAEYYYGSSGLTTALQFGYTFQKNIDSKFSFTPQFALPILIDSDVDIFWPSYNLSFRYGGFLFGAISQFAYEYPTGFQVGWQKNGWRVLLSNNFKDINYNYTDEYTANLTLRYIFNQDKESSNILKSIY